MTENVLKIKIERNVYGGGALNFYIFNPETEEYEGKNAVSDENRLLKYTSDTRDLTEYAREMLSVLADTYRRIDRIEIHFYGILEDADILSAALNDVIGTDTRITLIPHCDISPEELLARLNRYIDSLNKKIDQFLSSDAFSEYSKLGMKPSLIVENISRIADSQNTNELIERAYIALKQIKDLSKELKRGNEQIRESCNQCGNDATEHLSQIKTLTEEIEALFSQSFAERIGSTWKKQGALVECYRSTLEEAVKRACNKYRSSGLVGDDVRFRTEQFTADFVMAVSQAIKKTLLNEFKTVYVTTAVNFQKRYSELCEVADAEADVADALRQSINLDGIIFNSVVPDVRKYIHSGKPDGLFDRFDGVKYDTKLKRFSIDFRRYSERFINKPDLLFYYTDDGVKQAIKYLTDDIFKADFETAVRGLPDRKLERLRNTAGICDQLADEVDTLSAEVNKQKETFYAQLRNTKEGGAAE